MRKGISDAKQRAEHENGICYGFVNNDQNQFSTNYVMFINNVQETRVFTECSPTWN